MTFNTFLELTMDTYYYADYDSDILEDYNSRSETDEILHDYDFICTRYNCGGMTGGSCWNDEPPHEYLARENEIPDFSELLSKVIKKILPNIKKCELEKIENDLSHTFEYTDYEYYGNSSNYVVTYVNMKDLYNYLIELKLL